MKKKVLRFLAVLLIFSICTSLLPESVFAVTVEESVEETTPTIADFLAGTATAEDIYGVLDPSIVPAAIDYNEAVEKNHIARCYEDEGTDLNKIIFLNIDGTKTMYTFDFPVKYVDDNGNIQDIRLEIAESAVNAGAFETAANNTVTTFSAQFTDGITLEGNDTEIRLIPILPAPDLSATLSTTDMVATTATAQRIDADTVAYPYDAKTTVEYSLTYTGFKEDIVVSEYTGQTEYPFRLLTNGLALEEIGGSFFLVDDQGNIEASIGDIIIFTADERNNAFGDIEPKTIVENQEYLLNIVVDAEYLADPATTYPIRIDPTVKINYNYGAGAVEDITISTNTNFSGSYDYLFVGRRQTEGIARILMRFPGLDMSQLAGATVTDAHVRIRDMMCEDVPLDVSCHIFTGNVWAESSATWANCSPDSYVSTPLSTNTLKWSIGNTFSNKHWYQFDVTEAVQGWVNGNYSQNKGFLFKVASTVENGSTIQNRTFGSYNRTNYRPSLTVTYSVGGGTVSIREGGTSTLSAAGITGTIPWASSNTGIATVTASGVVTGVKAGHTTVTASVNGVVEKTFDVYVAVADGVYYIKNNNSGYYVGVEDSNIMSASGVIQEPQRTSNPRKYSQLWKITYLADGKYSIRPMHQLNTGLSAYQTDVNIWDIDETDSISAVADDCEWTISYSSSGYVFRHEGLAARTLVPVNHSTSGNAALTVESPSSISAAHLWTLENVTSTIQNTIIFYDKEKKVLSLNPVRYIAPEESKTCAGLKLYASFVSVYTNEQDIVWSVGDADIAVIDAATGKITGNTPSAVTAVNASMTYNGTTYSRSYTMNVTAVPNGTYYLRNKETALYADIYNQTAANGITVQQWEFSGDDSQKWKVTHRGDGTYTIRTAATTSYVYMGVSGNSVASGANIVLCTGTVEDGMRWIIQTTASGAYRFIPKSGESANLVLTALGSNPSGNGATLQQRTYINDVYYEDEWKIIYTGNVNFYALKHSDGGLRSDYFEYAKYWFRREDGNAFSNVTTQYAEAWSKEAMIAALQNYNVFFIHTHGNKTAFQIGSNNTLLTMWDINEEDFSNLEIALLLTCNTGVDFDESHITNNSPVNIIEAMVIQGAETVIGFSETTYVDDCNQFAEDFAKQIAFYGLTVEEAIDALQLEFYDKNMKDLAVIAGNPGNALLGG